MTVVGLFDSTMSYVTVPMRASITVQVGTKLMFDPEGDLYAFVRDGAREPIPYVDELRRYLREQCVVTRVLSINDLLSSDPDAQTESAYSCDAQSQWEYVVHVRFKDGFKTQAVLGLFVYIDPIPET